MLFFSILPDYLLNSSVGRDILNWALGSDWFLFTATCDYRSYKDQLKYYLIFVWLQHTDWPNNASLVPTVAFSFFKTLNKIPNDNSKKQKI